MMCFRFLAVTACLVVTNTAANAAVTLNGTALPQADARPDVTVGIVELRENGDPVIRLVPGLKRYGVSVVSKSPIATLEAELPVTSASARFSVGAGGRTFRNCLVASLASDPLDNERLVYALRCEGVTIP
jgi:hypothetical protein